MWEIIKKNLMIVAILLFVCNLAAGADQREGKREPENQQKVENPYEGARVLIEALLVEVKLDALEKAGAGPLSKEPPSATKILDIIKDKNAGKIKATEKLAIIGDGEGRMNATSQTGVPVEQDPNGKVTSWRQYDIGSMFYANLDVNPDGRILMTFEIDLTILDDNVKSEILTPDVSKYHWRSTVTLESGMPIVAGALEKIPNMTYLILRADIQQEPMLEKKK